MFSLFAGRFRRFRTGRLWPHLAGTAGLLAVSTGIIMAAAAPAQKSVVIPLLPAPAWKIQSSSSLSLQQLSQFGDQVPVDKELGVTSGSERVYSMRNFRTSVIFAKAADPSSAYALYTLYRSEGMKPVKGIDLAVADGKFALMTRGDYFIRAILGPAVPDQVLRSLLISIGGARLSVENADSLPTRLPGHGLVPGTEKYVLGPAALKFAFPSFPARLIGFADGVEAKAGTYVDGGARMILLEISYPTPQLAEARYQQLDNALRLNQDVGPGSTYGRRDGSFALLVLNAKSHQAAGQFLNRFRITQVVSSVPAYPRKENIVLEVVQLFVANGELIGLIIVFSILGGIVIYLAKRLIMKAFPKSTWIRADDDIVIRLKLS